ncbi:glucosyltransferase domain-containing protein [Lactococcus nasutitermitis]|uniref:Glucosyltransferase domain-containing protein n=1 Tax=Lactococcus nasutitermitis TaxID=1652957 RepID=A0ABV9JDJ7_9LACT|nr:glucosyltransferase domain-containing protein [Lactococcus nasutitermitis]
MKNKIFSGKNFLTVLSIILATIVTYLPYFKNTVGIDTSTMMLNQRQMLQGYLSQGRFGIVWFFDSFVKNYNNEIVPFMAVFLLILIGIYFYFLLDNYLTNLSKMMKAIFAILFVNNPVIYAQLYFKLQAIEICLGILLVLVASHLCLLERPVRLVKFILSVILLSFAILIYQSFAFFIFSLFLFYLLIFPEKRREVLQTFFPALLVSGLVYIVVYWLYSLRVQYSTYGAQTYLMWNRFASLGHLKQILMLGMLVAAVFFVILSIWTIVRARKYLTIDAHLLVLLLMSLLTFNVFFGNIIPTPRVYFGTFSVVGIGLLYTLVNRARVWRFLAGSLAILSLLLTFGLAHKANVSFANDVQLTQKVTNFANQKQAKTVVFIGNLQVGNQGAVNKIADLFITGATRTSFFQFDEPLISVRPYDFMRLQGHDFPVADKALRQAMVTKYENLPAYPAAGAFIFDEDSQTVVVKLSD